MLDKIRQIPMALQDRWPDVADLIDRIRTNKRLARWLVNLFALLILYWVTQAITDWLARPKFVDIMSMSRLAGQSPVVVEPLKKEAFAATVTYTGSVRPFYESDIRSRIQGWVDDVLVDEGDVVREGVPLLRLDQREAGGQLAQAKADLAFWEAELKRMERLYAEKAVSRFDYDNTTRQYQAAQGRFEAASAMYSYTEITAPFTGLVARRFVDPGDLVNPGVTLLHLVDLRRVRVQVKAAEEDIEHIKVGTQVVARFPSFSNPDGVREASVTTVFPELDPVTRTMTVEIVMNNPDALIKPDMYTVVDFIVARRQNVITVPVSAVVTIDGTPTVFTTDGIVAHARPVVLGVTDGHRVEIAQGLEEAFQTGERLIVKGQRGLVDGQQVNVVTF